MSPHLDFFLHILVWDLIALGIALAAYPLFLRLLPRHLAWAGARLVSPILVAYLLLVASVIFVGFPFNRTTILCGIGFLAVVSWGFFRPRQAKSKLGDRGVVLPFELGHFIFLSLAIAYVPFIDSLVPVGERIRDTSLLNAVWTQQVFPFMEPWLAGFQVQYYTFGYYICGVLGLLAGDKVLTAYNLMIAWTFATYAGSLWLLFRSLGFGKWGACLGTAVIALGSHVLCFAEAAQHLFSGGAYDWWAVSRVISHTITEFPIWTASLGDLHPHYLAMPFFILFLSHTFIQLFGKEEVDRRRAWIYVLSAAPLAAWIWGANTWDLPVVLIIGGGAIGLRARKLGPATLAKLGAAMLAMTTLLALPFLGSAPKAPKEFGWVHVRSSIVELWLFFGFFFAPILWGIYRRLRRQVPNDWFWGGGLVFVLSVIFQSATLFILTALYFLFQAWYRETPDRQGLPVFLATAGFGILLGCEIVHLQDIFGDTMERLNTVFKFYIPAWALLGISAFLFMAEIIPAIPRPWSRLLAVVWAIALSGHLVAGLSARNNGFAGPDRLAGMDFWLRTAPDDARVMDWTRQQVVAHQLKGVVLEAGGGAFTSFARFSSVSGLLGYEGWQVYGGMLQTFGNIRELGYRADKVKFFYSAGLPNCDALLSDLKKEKIDYVLVGMLERQIYPIAGLDLLRHCLHPVYEAGRTSLLAVAAPGV